MLIPLGTRLRITAMGTSWKEGKQEDKQEGLRRITPFEVLDKLLLRRHNQSMVNATEEGTTMEADNVTTLVSVIDRAKGWVTNGGPARYDMVEAEHCLEQALQMVRRRIEADPNQGANRPRASRMVGTD